MDYLINHYKLGEQPEVSLMPKEVLNELGEEGMRKVIGKHYDGLRVSSIKHLFPTHSDEAFELAKKHSADFFIQLCGGPQYFNESRGQPMMRARHSKFQITKEGRIVWLECFKDALMECELSEPLKQGFWDYLETFSFWMVNAEDS